MINHVTVYNTTSSVSISVLPELPAPASLNAPCRHASDVIQTNAFPNFDTALLGVKVPSGVANVACIFRFAHQQ